MSHILEVTNLEVEFSGDGGKNISVDHVGFHVDSGEIVCIVGESGCGKSVTALSVMGLLGKGGKVTAGRVLFEGRDLLSMTERELDGVRGDRLTMIFQDPLTSLNPVFTIGDLSLVLPKRHMDNIIEMIYALDKIAPGTANYDTLLYGVEVKFYSARINLSQNLETQLPNLFAIGDGAGITRGLAQAGASGVQAARAIAARV